MPFNNPLDDIFHPRSVAVIGASPDPISPGHFFLKPFIKGGFKGSIYPINRKGEPVLDLKGYASLLEIPGPVDYVVVCIPAATTPQLMRECAEKKVKAVAFFSAGFTETGEQQGIQLGKELVDIARAGGFRIVGPNCLGLYVPASGIGFTSDTTYNAGNFGFLSQSGGHTANIIRQATARGLLFSKAISYGNGSDLNEMDFLDYFGKDPETKIIGAYFEGVKNGRRFLQLLSDVAREKPLIVMKGGTTEAGRRAIWSHTASLAGEKNIWNSLVKQARVLSVSSIAHMVDAALAFRFLPPGRKRKIAVVGWGGGASVYASDELEKYGLYLPPPTAEVQKKLKDYNTAGSIIGNPFDTPFIFNNLQALKELIKVFASWEEVDLVLLQLGLGAPSDYSLELRGNLGNMVDAFVSVAQEIKKPVVIVLHSLPFASSWTAVFKEQEKCIRVGVPLYYSLEDAARALSLYNLYWEYRDSQ